MDHNVAFISTNGYKGMQHWKDLKPLEQELWQRQFIREHGEFDIDLTYTVPQNFPKRFLRNSKCKMAIYAYESSIMPERWKSYYHLVDYMLPPSKYVADMMERNGCPKEKIKVVPHGVDTNVFNLDVKPLDLKTDKSFKFLCVAEPHARKQLDKLLDIYCKNFTSDDDVVLVLKTKLFRTAEDFNKKKGFEVDLRPVIKRLKVKYGAKIPAIKIVSKRLNSMAGLYAACDAFVLMTASEGWGVPYLEALAMKLPVIAPRYGGQLQFLNDENALLTPCGTRKALNSEQYWGGHPKATVGNPDEQAYGEAMKSGFIERQEILRRVEQGYKDAQQLTWKNAMQQIIDIAKAHGK
jgi:glycosyltransferase involved in cell wall biosynthesis